MANPIPAGAVAAPAQIMLARGHWTALKFGNHCLAAARPLPPASLRTPEARAGFSFVVKHNKHGEFHIRLSRMPRAGSSVMMTIGDRPFLLFAQGNWAWSHGPLQETAIIAAIRGARSMRVEASDPGGRRFVDRYLLNGAPTAIDAAAAACAGKP